jgi:MOSC domain-containing protein YiiM
MKLSVLSVNIGRVRVIGQLHGEDVLSAIAKAPVEQQRIRVGALGLEGDAQADLSVHGGVDKAVYAYPADHWPWWQSAHALACAPARFGENLTLEGADESDVAIGDRFRWGEALLEISQPRSPCFKLAMVARQDIPGHMMLSARSGWYLRVLEEGEAPVRDAAMRRVFESLGPNVRETFLAAHHGGASLEILRRIHAAAALSRSWRESFAKKIAAFPG